MGCGIRSERLCYDAAKRLTGANGARNASPRHGVPAVTSTATLRLKGLREALSEDTTRAARFAFLTNEDYAAYYAALADEKGRCYMSDFPFGGEYRA